MTLRWGAGGMAFAGVMFLLYPALRPWHDETTEAGARASFESAAWVASHLFAMLGFIAVALAVLALRTVLVSRSATAAVVVTWIGAGLTLPYYGAEDFGLHGAARAGAEDLVGLADQVRFTPVAATMFAIGLLALGAGAILVALALRRPAAYLYALGFALFLPQFFLPPAARIGHGILLAAGCLWMASSMWRTSLR